MIRAVCLLKWMSGARVGVRLVPRCFTGSVWPKGDAAVTRCVSARREASLQPTTRMQSQRWMQRVLANLVHSARSPCRSSAGIPPKSGAGACPESAASPERCRRDGGAGCVPACRHRHGFQPLSLGGRREGFRTREPVVRSPATGRRGVIGDVGRPNHVHLHGDSRPLRRRGTHVRHS